MVTMRFLPLLLGAISSYAGANLLRQESSLDLSQWNQGHEADANQFIQLSIALAIQNADLGAETLLRISDPTSPDYGKYLSADEVARMFKPKLNAISDVMKWLEESGIDRSHVRPSYGGSHLNLNVSIQQATLLLKTTFHHQTHQETRQEQIACKHYNIPESLDRSIDYILAASPVRTHQQTRRQQVVLNNEATALAPIPSTCYDYLYPSCLRALYNIPNYVPEHPNNSIGIFVPSYYSWRPKDLDMFFRDLGEKKRVGQYPKMEAINGGYVLEDPPGERWIYEADLDFQYAMALTTPQEVTNLQVGSDHVGNLDNMLAAFDKYYCDPINERYKDYPAGYPEGCNTTACDCGTLSPPKVISISYGYTEAGFSPNYLQRQCLEFLKLGLMGTTVVVSVSDHGTTSQSGSFCIDDPTGNATGGKFSPTFPSTCPWLTSVGGTQMLRSPTAAPNEETVFRGDVTSSGGGFSTIFDAPPYQVPNIASYKEIEKGHLVEIQDRFRSTGRGYPDVSARADRFKVVLNKKWKELSGTSGSNPVFASIITLINNERMNAGKGPVGFINPVLYSNPGMFNDIVTGANRGCGVDEAFRAARGWDPVTGMGSPDYERMRDLFMSLP